MLILTRKENESIRIGDDIVITISRIQGNRVRFAIGAPPKIRIVRGELRPLSVAEVDKIVGATLPKPSSGEVGCGTLLAM